MDAPSLGRYLSGEFNADWIDDVGFLERANGKGVKETRGRGLIKARRPKRG
jgi:hypothetical protein